MRRKCGRHTESRVGAFKHKNLGFVFFFPPQKDVSDLSVN